MFETFNSPVVFLESSAALALFASGRNTGVAIESGHGATNISPVYEGHVLFHAGMRFDIAGRDLTDYMMKVRATVVDVCFVVYTYAVILSFSSVSDRF